VIENPRAIEPIVARDGVDDHEIEKERRELPDEQGLEIGQMRERRRRRQEIRRIVPAVYRALLAEFRVLLADMAGDVEGRFRVAAQRFQSRDPDLGEIRAERLVVRSEPVMSQGDHGDDRCRREGEEYERIGVEPLAREPAAAAYALPHDSTPSRSRWRSTLWQARGSRAPA
jgi:hypothetical protein